MSLNWPTNPFIGATYSGPAGALWRWNGYGWAAVGSSAPTGPQGASSSIPSGIAYWNGAYGYTATIGSAVSYLNGDVYYITPNSTNSSYTSGKLYVNINNIGNIPIVKNGQLNLCQYDLNPNEWYKIVYNSSYNVFNAIGFPNFVTGVYDFSQSGGATGTYNLFNDISNLAPLPANIILRFSDAFYQIGGTFSSSGTPSISMGISSAGPSAESWNYAIDPPRSISQFTSNNTIKVRSSFWGSFTLVSGTTGSVNSVKLGGIEILGGTVSYSSSLSQTAANVASRITMNPISVMSAESVGTTVNIYTSNFQKFSYPFRGTNSASLSTLVVSTTGLSAGYIRHFNTGDAAVWGISGGGTGGVINIYPRPGSTACGTANWTTDLNTTMGILATSINTNTNLGSFTTGGATFSNSMGYTAYWNSSTQLFSLYAPPGSGRTYNGKVMFMAILNGTVPFNLYQTSTLSGGYTVSQNYVTNGGEYPTMTISGATVSSGLLYFYIPYETI